LLIFLDEPLSNNVSGLHTHTFEHYMKIAVLPLTPLWETEVL